MTILKAYEITLNKVNMLKEEHNIPLKVVEMDDAVLPKNEKELHSDDWINIIFKPENDNQVKIIDDTLNELLDMGISFDTGRGFGRIDWSIDWSFEYIENENAINDKKIRMNIVADLAKQHNIGMPCE